MGTICSGIIIPSCYDYIKPCWLVHYIIIQRTNGWIHVPMMCSDIRIPWYHNYTESFASTLQWHHNGRDSVSNHQPHECLLNRSSRCRLKKTSKLRVTGLCAGNSPETGEFPAQMASNTENVFIWWRHNERMPYSSIDWTVYFVCYMICALLIVICDQQKIIPDPKFWNQLILHQIPIIRL